MTSPDNNGAFFCIECLNKKLPFGFENDFIFNQSINLGIDRSNLNNLNFNISKKEKKMINQLSRTIFESNDPNIRNSYCNYYSTDELLLY